MEDKRIPDSSIKASSAWSIFYQAANGRLNFKGDYYYKAGGWVAKTWDKNPWFEVNFGSAATVSRVATQGIHNYGAWVKTFMLAYKKDGNPFVFYNNKQVSELFS